MGSAPFKRDGGDVYDGTIEYDINQLGELAAMSGTQYSTTGLNTKIQTDPGIYPEENPDAGKVGKRVINPLPDGYGRIFHLSISGNILAADAVIGAMVQRNAAAKSINLSATGSALACSATASATTSGITPMKTHMAVCNDASKFDKYGVPDYNTVQKYITVAATQPKPKTVKSTDTDFTQPVGMLVNNVQYNFAYGWIKGCKTTQDSIDANDPLFPGQTALIYFEWVTSQCTFPTAIASFPLFSPASQIACFDLL